MQVNALERRATEHNWHRLGNLLGIEISHLLTQAHCLRLNPGIHFQIDTSAHGAGQRFSDDDGSMTSNQCRGLRTEDFG